MIYVHGGSRIFHEYIFSWTLLKLFLNQITWPSVKCLWIVHELFMFFSWIVHEPFHVYSRTILERFYNGNLYEIVWVDWNQILYRRKYRNPVQILYRNILDYWNIVAPEFYKNIFYMKTWIHPYVAIWYF